MATTTTKRVIRSPKVKANNDLFARINKAAVRFIYDSGVKGAIVPTWKTALARARATVTKKAAGLAGTKKPASAKAKATSTTKKRATR